MLQAPARTHNSTCRAVPRRATATATATAAATECNPLRVAGKRAALCDCSRAWGKRWRGSRDATQAGLADEWVTTGGDARGEVRWAQRGRRERTCETFVCGGKAKKCSRRRRAAWPGQGTSAASPPRRARRVSPVVWRLGWWRGAVRQPVSDVFEESSAWERCVRIHTPALCTELLRTRFALLCAAARLSEKGLPAVVWCTPLAAS